MPDSLGRPGDVDLAPTTDQRRRAARAVAATARDAAECARLLEMLGLRPEEASTPTRRVA